MEVVSPLSDGHVTEFQNVTLECELSKPNQRVEWFKDGVVLPLDDSHYTITNTDCSYTLQLNNAQMDDDAQYTLKCGDVETTAKITVEGDYFFITFTSF